MHSKGRLQAQTKLKTQISRKSKPCLTILHKQEEYTLMTITHKPSYETQTHLPRVEKDGEETWNLDGWTRGTSMEMMMVMNGEMRSLGLHFK